MHRIITRGFGPGNLIITRGFGSSLSDLITGKVLELYSIITTGCSTLISHIIMSLSLDSIVSLGDDEE